jgi:DnaK suppressor protein
MQAGLSSTQVLELRQLLHDRESRLSAELASARARADEETFVRMAGEAPDRGDASVAQLSADLVSAERQRDSDERDEVQAALERIEAGTYGLCIYCGEPIGYERLKASPTARRDLVHEEEYERARGDVATPRL